MALLNRNKKGIDMLINKERKLKPVALPTKQPEVSNNHKHSRDSTLDTNDHKNPIIAALDMSVPSWPLQNTVAVNPFWNQKERHFNTVMSDLSSILHGPLYMPLDYYLSKYKEGAISQEALRGALEQAKALSKNSPNSVDELLQFSKVDGNATPMILSFAEHYDKFHGTAWKPTIIDQVGKFAAAFFNDTQTSVTFPWRSTSFWQSWCNAQEFDRSMEIYGAQKFRRHVKSVAMLKPEEFILNSLEKFGLKNPLSQSRYLSRLIAKGFGWSTQFKYNEWQKALGYTDVSEARTVEYLAVLVAYDFALAQSLVGVDSLKNGDWIITLNSASNDTQENHNTFELHQIWQNASEFEYQTRIASQIEVVESKPSSAKYQIVMCIDVRSEIIRRAIEKSSSDIETIGFAGFFGVPFDYKKSDEKVTCHRLPVLLTPAFSIEQKDTTDKFQTHTNKISLYSFLRHLRKEPLGSFSYVELFGLNALLKSLYQVINSFFARSPSEALPKRFSNEDSHLGQPNIDIKSMTTRCATVLKHMGLNKNLGRLVVIAGHGTVNTNNAFSSSLDCGACGGHAGDINARVLVRMLNDIKVREGLVSEGIIIPGDTYFLAAVHETVTDSIYFLEENSLPENVQQDFVKLKENITYASEIARKERQGSRSIYLDSSAKRRSLNWAEVRPEWGLAGNACFIVAPRAWTKHINFSSRAFLHDYDASSDQDFATLELIMTAPMIVTNWINLQYYASTVAPSIYGAGNKTIHNVVNDCAVLEGNGGDLRFGLPIQSVHDGEHFVHEPLRLSVFIAAPRSALENVISKHSVVKSLVDNQWLYLLQVDLNTNSISRRLPNGLYEPISFMKAS